MRLGIGTAADNIAHGRSVAFNSSKEALSYLSEDGMLEDGNRFVGDGVRIRIVISVDCRGVIYANSLEYAKKIIISIMDGRIFSSSGDEVYIEIW
jgi:hypothetical protein